MLDNGGENFDFSEQEKNWDDPVTADAYNAAQLVLEGDKLLYTVDENCLRKYGQAREITLKQKTSAPDSLALIAEREKAWYHFAYFIGLFNNDALATELAVQKIFGLQDEIQQGRKYTTSDQARNVFLTFVAERHMFQGNFQTASRVFRQLMLNDMIGVWLCYCLARIKDEGIPILIQAAAEGFEHQVSNSEDPRQLACIQDFCFFLAWIATRESGGDLQAVLGVINAPRITPPESQIFSNMIRKLSV